MCRCQCQISSFFFTKYSSEISKHITPLLPTSSGRDSGKERERVPTLTAFYSPTCRVNKLFLSRSCKSANAVQKCLAGRRCLTIPSGVESEGLGKCFLNKNLKMATASYSKNVQFYTNQAVGYYLALTGGKTPAVTVFSPLIVSHLV